MKIKLGPYINWYGPYQIAEILCFWAKEEKDEYGIPEKPEWVHNFGEWLADTWVGDFCQWIHDKRERKVVIKIDRYDTWNMNDTLALIIHPMLVQLKETKHGSPDVDDEDVPEELRSTSAPKKENEWDTDDNWHKRWDYVLDEMIWAFGQTTIDWESQYHSGDIDWVFAPVDKEGNDVPKEEAKLFRMDKGPNDTHKFDSEGLRAHGERIANGYKLFGKYYGGLWD